MPPDAVVCDIGGGTIDLIGAERTVVAAGAGETITVAVARVLGIPRALAETGQAHPRRPGGGPARRARGGRSPRLPGLAGVPRRDRQAVHPGWRRPGAVLQHSWPPRSGAACGWPSSRRRWRRTSPAACGPSSEPPTALVLAGGGALDDELLRTVGEALRARPGRGRARQHRRSARPAVRGGARPGRYVRAALGSPAIASATVSAPRRCGSISVHGRIALERAGDHDVRSEVGEYGQAVGHRVGVAAGGTLDVARPPLPSSLRISVSPVNR